MGWQKKLDCRRTSTEQMQICIALRIRIDFRNWHKLNICPVRSADPVSEISQTRSARCELSARGPSLTSLTCHSITSSAQASNSSDMVWPNTFAVLRLVDSSKFGWQEAGNVTRLRKDLVGDLSVSLRLRAVVRGGRVPPLLAKIDPRRHCQLIERADELRAGSPRNYQAPQSQCVHIWLPGGRQIGMPLAPSQ
jgi:hypothetical protein